MTITNSIANHELETRLASCIPGATFELEAFLSLAEIRETTEIPTAAVTTGDRPRLLLNPEFLETHCQTDEHLFLLVVHELWHVLFAHTRLRTRPTPAENIAFDAIINATLAAKFPAPEYRGFFESLNSADRFPGLLLRPPEGWPHHPTYRTRGPKGTADVLRRLYPAHGEWEWMPTYGELVDLITNWRGYEKFLQQERHRGIDGPAVPGGDHPWLLGDHDGSAQSLNPMADPVLRSVLGDVTKSWPEPPQALELDSGEQSTSSPWIVAPRPPRRSVERDMESVLHLACVPRRNGIPRRDRVEWRSPVQTPIPFARDRQRLARRRLGSPTLLWNGEIQTRRVGFGQPSTAQVYLDVSGSMADIVPKLLVPLEKFVARRLARTWQFSTVVSALSLEDLRSGTLDSTGGTSVDCVLRHALDDPHTTSIVIITDGYISHPAPGLVDRLKERSISVRSVVSAGGNISPIDVLGPVTRLGAQ